MFSSISGEGPTVIILFMDISDLLHYLKVYLPSDGYCIIGLTWVDLYPSEEWNFVLGESSCVDGCAVMSFGHFEPQSYNNKQLKDTLSNSKNSTTFSSMPEKENCQGDISCYFEDFADIQTVDRQMIWRLLRVRSHVCGWLECYQ